MKRILYLGTDPKEFASKATGCEVTHYPVIQIVPRKVDSLDIQQAYADLDKYTHCIFTSKNAVEIFFDHLELMGKKFVDKQVIAVGSVTASHLAEQGVMTPWVAQEETQEGIIALLKTLDLHNAYLFIPQSSRSRPVLLAFLSEAKISYRACHIYDTVVQVLEPKPFWEMYDQVVFTSPSTVEAFLSIFGQLPPQGQCLAIGPVTRSSLLSHIEKKPKRRFGVLKGKMKIAKDFDAPLPDGLFADFEM